MCPNFRDDDLSGPKGIKHRFPHKLCGNICYCSWPPNLFLLESLFWNPCTEKSGTQNNAKGTPEKGFVALLQVSFFETKKRNVSRFGGFWHQCPGHKYHCEGLLKTPRKSPATASKPATMRNPYFIGFPGSRGRPISEKARSPVPAWSHPRKTMAP